jgi:hypothetical protein
MDITPLRVIAGEGCAVRKASMSAARLYLAAGSEDTLRIRMVMVEPSRSQ